MESTPIFNLSLTYEEALEGAKAFQAAHKASNGKGLHIWEDPHDFYNQRMKFRLDGIYAETFDKDIEEIFEVGKVDSEARAALIWLIKKHKGFNCLELGQVIVGVQGGIEDKEVAVFTYLSKEDDCLRDFISELAFNLTNR